MGKWYNNKIPIVIICSKGASLSNLGCLAGNCRMKPHLCPIPHFLDWTASGRGECHSLWIRRSQFLLRLCHGVCTGPRNHSSFLGFRFSKSEEGRMASCPLWSFRHWHFMLLRTAALTYSEQQAGMTGLLFRPEVANEARNTTYVLLHPNFR